MSLSLVQAAHGQVFVVAESHLIFLRRHPSQARITSNCQKCNARAGPGLPLSRLCLLCSSTKTKSAQSVRNDAPSRKQFWASYFSGRAPLRQRSPPSPARSRGPPAGQRRSPWLYQSRAHPRAPFPARGDFGGTSENRHLLTGRSSRVNRNCNTAVGSRTWIS